MDIEMVNKSTMHLSIYQRIPMPITIYWSSDCWLLFGTWHTTEDDFGLFIFGCVLVFFCNIIMFVLPIIKKKYSSWTMGSSLNEADQLVKTKMFKNDKIKENDKDTTLIKIRDILCGLLFFTLKYIMSIVNMLLLMSFNGWLVISIIIGATAGYFIRVALFIGKNTNMAIVNIELKKEEYLDLNQEQEID